MKLIFSVNAWEDTLHWQRLDQRVVNRIDILIKDIQENKYKGVGKPEPLQNDLSGYWSRRINRKHRLIYKIEKDKIMIAQLKYHY